jgi:hypothetical protein
MVFAEKQKHMPKATGVGVCHTTGYTRGYSCLTTSWSGDYRRPSACLRLGLVSLGALPQVLVSQAFSLYKLIICYNSIGVA